VHPRSLIFYIVSYIFRSPSLGVNRGFLGPTGLNVGDWHNRFVVPTSMLTDNIKVKGLILTRDLHLGRS